MMDDLHILLINTVETDAVMIACALSQGRQSCDWACVNTEAGLRDALTREPWDIIIAHHCVQGVSGVEALAIVRTLLPAAPFIILSDIPGERLATDAMRAGAQDYFLMSEIGQLSLAVERELENARRLAAVNGVDAIDGNCAIALGSDGFTGNGAPLSLLTARQKEVLKLVAEGETTKKIAYRLGVSGKTVEAHRAQIMHRLHIHDVAGLVCYAIRNGITTAER